jgi:hypothetical protein
VKLPVNDWQFWVVTAAAAGALLVVLRNLVPGRWWPWKRRVKGKSASLTIEGKGVGKKQEPQ